MLKMHAEIKEQHREKVDNDALQRDFEKHAKKQEVKFQNEMQELQQLVDAEKLAETFTNCELYREQEREMEKLSKNLEIYQELVKGEEQRVFEGFEELEGKLGQTIKEYFDK